MVRKGLIPVLFVVALLLVLLVTIAVAAPASGSDADGTSAAASPPPIAIGAMRLSGTHLVPPARDPLLAMLRQEGLPVDATEEQIAAASKAWFERFRKQSDTFVNADFQEWVQQREAQLATGAAGAMAVQPVEATVFAIAVDFGMTETFTLPVEQPDGSCLPETVTIKGPRAGEIPPPLSGDNFTLWYSPEKTLDAKFYEKIIFGYEGAGRARYDLTDPEDGMPGINLAGLTVQDYYDGVAGEGNVTINGTVEGWVTVPHSEGRYGADNCEAGTNGGGADVPVAQLVVDAIEVFSDTNPTYYMDTSPDAFWPTYDANDDGILDTFWLIHAGMGQEAGGGEQGTFAIWSHSSDLRNYAQWQETGYKVYEGDTGTTDDDIYVGPYTMQPENAEVGVFAEEFGHNFFGLPDLYTSDASNSIGFWSIMSGGAWMGWLGGTRPASMPLWFKMIAAFDQGGTIIPVNWHEPMVSRQYDDPAGDVTIGQLEKTPDGVNKGVRIDLPEYTVSIDNLAGTGKAAYSGTGRNQADAILEREVAIPADGQAVLSMAAFWQIEEDWDYGYLTVNGTTIPDLDGYTTDSDPNGNNLGNGLTGEGEAVLRFDLSAYKGQTVTIGLRYKTDAAATEDGWWVDDVTLDDTLLDDFESATESSPPTPDDFPGWTNSDPGWYVVPRTATHQRYYLVEWRSMTKYDQMIAKTAYVHETLEPDKVTRVPYNMPAALLYYRDTQYGATYAMRGNAGDPPSYGSKYQLLIVDQNWEPLRLGDTPETYEGYWTGRLSSYDSGLTLQDSQAFVIPSYFAVPGSGPWSYAPKPAVTKFNDTLGYYGGFYFGPPCDPGYVCFAEQDGSAVIPARGTYSTRITDFAGAPIYGLYDVPFPPSSLGSGDPGGDNVQLGVNIELKSKAGDDAYNSTATLGFWNYSLDIVTDVTAEAVATPALSYAVIYETVVHNMGDETAEGVRLDYDLDGAFVPTWISIEGPAGTQSPESRVSVSVPPLAPGERFTATVVMEPLDAPGPRSFSSVLTAYDGQVSRGPWFLEGESPLFILYLNNIYQNAQ